MGTNTRQPSGVSEWGTGSSACDKILASPRKAEVSSVVRCMRCVILLCGSVVCVFAEAVVCDSYDCYVFAY